MSRKQRSKQSHASREKAAPARQTAGQSGTHAPGPGNGAAGAANGTKNGKDAAPGNGSVKAKAAKRSAVPPARRTDGPLEEPLQKGDMVVIRMRSDWELEGELRAINDDVVRIFDFAVCDVLRLRRKDIARIERLVDGD